MMEDNEYIYDNMYNEYNRFKKYFQKLDREQQTFFCLRKETKLQFNFLFLLTGGIKRIWVYFNICTRGICIFYIKYFISFPVIFFR